MRPRTLEDIVGQERIVGPGTLLRRAIEADRLGSIILFGPPGCGKTSLAEVIAATTARRFERASGALSNVAELRAVAARAESERRSHGDGGSILFVDEIHRFNKAQQDVLLPHVESGALTLIGATTHNPMFFVNGPLNSRSLIFELQPLSEEAIERILERALNEERGLAEFNASAAPDALRHMARMAEGDARRALNALEIAVLSTAPDEIGRRSISLDLAEASVQKKVVLYDRDEDGHYDTISAFIKSLRGSAPDAAVYWLAKMLYAGEDPRFIARRLVIFASEDVGNADPRGLTLAVSALDAVSFVGMPEARIVLAHATTYLATAPKSNASYVAIESAMKDVMQGRTLPVPEHLKNVHVQAEGKPEAPVYKYPHSFEGHFVRQEYAPTGARYYSPSDQGYEETIAKRMERWLGAPGTGGQT